MTIRDITKGDSATLEFCINADITNWKIRAEINDICKNSIKKANDKSGGSIQQIEVIDAGNGIFNVYIARGETKCFNDKSFIEIEVDTGLLVGGKEEIITVLKWDILFNKQQIDWVSP